MERRDPYALYQIVPCVRSLMALLPLRAEAADVYSVIYSDASYYNGNPTSTYGNRACL